MTGEIHVPEAPRGRSCRTCRKWDGIKCTDMRHRHNDDPDRPCMLYRYREQDAVEPVEGEAKRCRQCRRLLPISAFSGYRGRETSACTECLMRNRSNYQLRSGSVRPGRIQCPACGRQRGPSEFISADGKRKTITCARCREERSALQRSRTGGHDEPDSMR